jgi:hypothetical protein
VAGITWDKLLLLIELLCEVASVKFVFLILPEKVGPPYGVCIWSKNKQVKGGENQSERNEGDLVGGYVS